MSAALRIGIVGLGTVGAGTVRLLATHAGLLAQRCGRRLEVAAVSARERDRDRGIDVSAARWYDDPTSLAAAAEVDVVVELIGGSQGVALEVCRAAIANGKSLVTANKALLAHQGTALALAAEEAGVSLGYEAAVAGGIPIVKALREGLAGNGVSRVYGILNGTCNYILSAMREGGREFAEVLAEAQRLGYAEADPSIDIEARIGLGVAQRLRLRQHVVEIAPGLAHFAQDVVAGAVQNAVDAADLVAGEALAQRFDDRDAAGHGGLEADRDAGRLGRPGECGAMFGD